MKSRLGGVEKRRSDFSLPVAIGQVFTWPPQSGLTWFWFLLPGRPGEVRPEPPTDPDVNLSIHPARATLEKAAAFHQDKEFLRLPVDSIPTWVTRPRRSTGITPLLRYYEAVRPRPAHRYFQPRGSSTCAFPFASPARFSSCIRKPELESRLLCTGTPHGQ
jgi:hypothetical protein